MYIKIRKENVIYLLCAFLFLEPKLFSIAPNLKLLHYFLQTLLIIVSIISIVSAITTKRYVRPNKNDLILFCFFSWLELSNIIHGKIGRDFLLQVISMIALIIIIERAQKSNKLADLLREFTICGSLIVIGNLISQLVCGENGVYHDWVESWQSYYICGNANSFVFYYLLVLGIIFAYANQKKSFLIWSYVIHGIMIYSLFYTLKTGGSTTGFIVIASLFIVRIVSIDIVRKFFLKYYRIIVIIGLGIAGWIVIGNGWKSQWLLNFLQKYLNENASFLARGTIWNNALILIKKSPLIGYGTNAVRITRDMDGILRSAHNNYLEIAIMGGIPAMVIYCYYIGRVIKNTQKQQYLLIVTIIMYIVTYIVEQDPFNIGFYMILSICNLKGNYLEKKNVKS